MFDGFVFLFDFGIVWFLVLLVQSEFLDDKILDIGIGFYCVLEVFFGNKSYGIFVDMWVFGVMFVEVVQSLFILLFEL